MRYEIWRVPPDSVCYGVVAYLVLSSVYCIESTAMTMAGKAGGCDTIRF